MTATDYPEVVKLIIAYTLTGAFVFTVVVTCLSLIGWVKFANQKQQRRLFVVLIIELVTVCLGFFSGLLTFNASAAVDDVYNRGFRAGLEEGRNRLLNEQNRAIISALKPDIASRLHQLPENSVSIMLYNFQQTDQLAVPGIFAHRGLAQLLSSLVSAGLIAPDPVRANIYTVTEDGRVFIEEMHQALVSLKYERPVINSPSPWETE
jgi:hypothetical protein